MPLLSLPSLPSLCAVGNIPRLSPDLSKVHLSPSSAGTHTHPNTHTHTRLHLCIKKKCFLSLSLLFQLPKKKIFFSLSLSFSPSLRAFTARRQGRPTKLSAKLSPLPMLLLLLLPAERPFYPPPSPPSSPLFCWERGKASSFQERRTR